MASTKEYLDFVLDQLSLLSGVSSREMMGEYVLYHQGKIIGGIYDDRFLIKQTFSSGKMMPSAPLEEPYPGAKKMLLVTEIDDRDFLARLVQAVSGELPAPKKK